MRLLIRTYAHSRRASIVSVAGIVMCILFVLGAIGSMIVCTQTEEMPWLVSTVTCVALSILSYRGSGRLADYLAIRDLEKKLGKTIIGD